MEASAEGMRALWISLTVLMATAVLQAVVVAFSGSVALLGDTLHNVTDVLTAIPLAIAFFLGRRVASRRFTYGYGRAEDLAGIVIVLIIAAAPALAGYEAAPRRLDPQEVRVLGWVAAAAVIGFAGNEWVARYRIRVGSPDPDRPRSSPTDCTPAAMPSPRWPCCLGAGGSALGPHPIVDPIVGLLITVAILLRPQGRGPRDLPPADGRGGSGPGRSRGADTARPPAVCGEVGSVRLRWVGHTLRAEVDIVVV